MGNPFEDFFTPGRESSTGFGSLAKDVGSLFGVPSMADRAAAARATAMNELAAKMQSNGGNPQKAVTDFLASPQGMELFSTPGALPGLLEDFTKAVTPPNPTAIQTGPGTQSNMFQNGKPIGTVAQPTTEVQNMQGGVPQQFSTGPGVSSDIYTRGQPSRTVQNPPTEAQNMRAGVPQINNVAPGHRPDVIRNGQVEPGQTQPQVTTTGPGSATNVIDPSKPNAPISQPVPEVQVFNDIARKLPGMDDETLRILGMNMVNPSEAQHKQAAITAMVNRGQLTKEEGDMFVSGAISVIDETNDANEKTGRRILYNKANGTMRIVEPTGTGYGAPPPATGSSATSKPGTAGVPPIPPGAINPDGTLDMRKAYNAKDRMGFGTGPIATMTAFAGHIVRSFNPSNNEQTSQAASEERDAILRLRNGAIEVGAANGGRLKAKVDGWLKLMPDTGIMDDPKNAYRNLRDLYDSVKLQIADEQEIANDRLHQDMKSRHAARDSIKHLNNLLSLMPNRETSQMMMNNITAGTSGAPNLGTALGTTIGLGRELVAPGTTNSSSTSAPVSPKLMQALTTETDPAKLQAIGTQLPPGPSPARTLYEQRLRELIAAAQKGGGAPAKQPTAKPEKRTENLPRVPAPPTAPNSPFPPHPLNPFSAAMEA